MATDEFLNASFSVPIVRDLMDRWHIKSQIKEDRIRYGLGDP
jgi:hypothetical protein